MKQSGNEVTVWLLLAIGAPLCIAALFWGISQLVLAVGTAIGIAGALMSAGSSIGDAVGVWAVRAAAIGLGVGGASIGYKVVVNVSQNIQSNVYSWVLPLASIFAGLLVELNKDFYPATPWLKHLFSALFAFSVLVAGYLFTKKSNILKACGLVLTVFPPGLMLLQIISEDGYVKVQKALISVTLYQYISFGIFAILISLVAILASRTKDS
ncbi:hypothetical protein AB4619_05065 [Vibrio splendidus]